MRKNGTYCRLARRIAMIAISSPGVLSRAFSYASISPCREKARQWSHVRRVDTGDTEVIPCLRVRLLETAAAEYGCDVSVSLGAALLMRTRLANDSLAEHDEWS
jgi:hypothetical protein